MKRNQDSTGVKPLDSMPFENRRARYYDITAVQSSADEEAIRHLEGIDLVYRTLCGVLYNFVPTSGHPGGSISSGRIVAGLLYNGMDYDIGDPDALGADLLCYAAGHKAMGLYAAWALRDELVRIGSPDLLPADAARRLRLEDMLGFRRNPTQETPLFKQHKAKPLDGHPTTLCPFVKLATGASGVGVTASFGLALGPLDVFGRQGPAVNVLEGEGGMTPGRVTEALAAAASARMGNLLLHVDFNQASIDSNRVCREGDEPGEYVQWTPAEMCFLNDWNVILVPDGLDFRQVLAAQELAASLDSDQPTAIVYRTIKGWRYGIEGRASHGAGHKFMSEGYFDHAVKEFEEFSGLSCPRLEADAGPVETEQAFYDTLLTLRSFLEDRREFAEFAAGRLAEARERLAARAPKPRSDAPDLSRLYSDSEIRPDVVPAELALEPGSKATLRATLGKVLNHLNKKTDGAFIACAADLLGSTSVSLTGDGFSDEGFYEAVRNPKARLIAVGGICEDAMGGFMAGLSSFGRHIGVSSSYGAFIAALEHVPARLHGIGQQYRHEYNGEPYCTWIMINAHTGIKTGEDGPTHADPQNLQLLSGNFPRGVMITLTPFDPAEIWPLTIEALKKRPAVLAPFVTRPGETVPDRAALKLAPANDAVTGVYALREADAGAKQYNGTVILQGSGAALAFVEEVLPELDRKGLNLNVYYVASAELFDLLPPERQDEIYPEARAREAMGITGLTLPTMFRWVTGREGRRRTLHPFQQGHYLGSGPAHKVMEEAGMHGEGQLKAVLDYAAMIEKR